MKNLSGLTTTTNVSQTDLLAVEILDNCHPCCNYLYTTQHYTYLAFEFTETTKTFVNKHYSLLNVASMCLYFKYTESAITL